MNNKFINKYIAEIASILVCTTFGMMCYYLYLAIYFKG